MKCMWILRCFSELFPNLKTCTAAQDQKQSSSAIMPYLEIKAQERIRARKSGLKKKWSRSENNLSENQAQSCFFPFPHPLQLSFASLLIGLEDNAQNLSFYCSSTDPSFHFLVLFWNIQTLALLSSYAGHLLLRLTSAKNIPSHL